MKIDKNTKVFDILEEYGDFTSVMEVFGLKRAGKYSIRRIITRFLTAERASKIHQVPLEEFLTCSIMHVINHNIYESFLIIVIIWYMLE